MRTQLNTISKQRTEIDTQETEVDKTETKATESTNIQNRKQTLPKSASLLAKCTDQNIQRIIDKYETVFVGEGKLNTQQVKLHINQEVTPVVHLQRQISYHLRKEASKELDWLMKTSSKKSISNLRRGYRRRVYPQKGRWNAYLC